MKEDWGVDHDVQTFQIKHEVETEDEAYLREAKEDAKTLVVSVDANNDDTAGINLAVNKRLRLTEGSSDTDDIKIASLNSQPLADVYIHALLPKNMIAVSALHNTHSKREVARRQPNP